MYRSYADDEMLVGKIDQVEIALDIFAEYGACSIFILNLTMTKGLQTTQDPFLISPLTKSYVLGMHLTSERVTILGFPLGSPAFVSSFIRQTMDAIDASLNLTATIPDGCIGHNIDRITALSFRMTHLLRLIPPTDVMNLWQSAWLERICIVPRSAAARRQELLPRSLSCVGLFSEVDIAPCAYIGSLFQSAGLRAVELLRAPTTVSIFAIAKPLIETL